MPRIPLIVHLGAWLQILPVVAYAASRIRTRPARWIALACAVSIVADLVSMVMSGRGLSNHVVTYVSSPLFAILLLAGLREWQLTRAEWHGFTVASALFLLSTLVLVAFVEDIGTFNRGIGPFYSLALMIGGLWTLARRTLENRASPVYQSDWFWVALGLAIYGASTALASPIAGYLIANDRADLVVVAWKIRAVFVIASFGLVAWGIYRGPLVSKFSTAT
jgi:hypothetical protein